MKIDTILESIYLIPIILEHFDSPQLYHQRLFKRLGIDKMEVEYLRRMRPLLQYHYDVIRAGKPGTVPRVPEYEDLRRGLGMYFNFELKTLFKQIGYVDKSWNVLDYGCGNGNYSFAFMEDNISSSVMLLDRAIKRKDLVLPAMVAKEIDFERSPEWHLAYKETFDLIIMAELLHCKGPIVQDYLIDSSSRMLRANGRLMVVENEDWAMQYRLNYLAPDGMVMDEADVVMAVDRCSRFNLKNRFTINQHNISIYEKI